MVIAPSGSSVTLACCEEIMVKKKLKELRELTVEELLKMRSDTQVAMRSIRFKSKIEKPSNPMEKRNLTKKVAVINTILRERELLKVEAKS